MAGYLRFYGASCGRPGVVGPGRRADFGDRVCAKNWFGFGDRFPVFGCIYLPVMRQIIVLRLVVFVVALTAFSVLAVWRFEHGGTVFDIAAMGEFVKALATLALQRRPPRRDSPRLPE